MDHTVALLEQNRLLDALTSTAAADTAVPTCPGWTLRSLVNHVGRGDRWAAAIVGTGGPVDIRAVADGKPPAGVSSEWLCASPRLLIDAVAEVGPDTPVWTFLGPRPAVWWIRRRLHESTVHRADAAMALGVPYELERELAADGVSENLALLAERSDGVAPLEDGTTLHLHATDDGLGVAGEWLVRGVDGGTVWEHGHGKGAVAVRGTARELLLAIKRRIPADRVEVLGDAAVFHTWLERTTI